MKKTSNSKKGTMPAGAPKGMHPLTYFNSLKGKPKTEPKQTLRKAQNGLSFKNTYSGPLTESDSKRLDQQFPSTVKNEPNRTYGDNAVANEKEDRAAFENYLRSPAVDVNNKTYGTGFNSESLWNQKYNRDAQVKNMNKMNNIDWNSEEGKREKFLLDRDYKEAFKKGGSAKRKK